MNSFAKSLILLIDDNDELRLMRKRVLEKNNFSVIDCDNGKDGILKAKHDLPDLILLDVVMPGMNGLEVLEELKNSVETSSVFVVLISAQHTSDDSVARGLEMGADGYLTSPISNRVLLAQVNTFLKQKRNMDLLRQSEQSLLVKNDTLEFNAQQISEINADYRALNTQMSETLEKLAESEKEFKLLASNAHDAIWTMDLKGQFTFISPSVEKLRGYTPEEVMRQPLEQIFTKPSMVLMNSVFMEALEWERKGIRRDHYHRIELQQPCKDGSLIWTEVITSPIRNDKGELVEILGLTRDISETKKIRLELRQNLERYRLAQQIGKVGNWEYNIKKDTFWGSEQARVIYGMTSDNGVFSVEDVEACIPERERVHQALVDLIEKGQEYNLEFEVHPKNSNKVIIIHSIAEVEKDENGNPSIVSGVIVDITDAKLAEQARLESEEKFRNLADSSPAAIMMYQDDRWVYVNAAASYITEYEQNELLDMKFWDFVHPDFKDIVTHTGRERQKLHSSPLRYEFKIITKSGKEKWVFLSGASTVYNGKPAGIITVVDITKRKDAEIALADSEERFKLLSNVTFESIVIHKKGIIQDVNKSFEKLTGFTKNEAVGRNLFEAIISKGDLDIVTQNVTKEYAKPYRILGNQKNGSKFWAEIEGKDILHKDEKIRIVAIRNISDRVKVEQALLESEEKYRSVINNSMEGIFVIQDELLVWANPSIDNFVGIPFELCEKRKFSDFVHPDDHMLIARNNQQRLEGIAIPSYDFRVVDVNDKIKWVHLNATRIVWNGRPAVLCFVSDIHDRKIAEHALVSSEEKFRTYIQSSPMAVFITNENGVYTFVNPAAAQMLGYTIKELLGKNFSKVLHPSELDGSIDGISRLQSTDGSRSTEVKMMKKNGSLINVDMEAVKVSGFEYMAYCRDITKLIQIQEELLQKNEEFQALNKELESTNVSIQNTNIDLALAKDKAEESDRLKSAFLANMSHEIRTPMNGILGFADLLKEPNLEGEKQKKYISVIENSGQRMLNIINDLIDISKIESGQMDVIMGQSNMNELLESLLSFFKPEAEKGKLRFELMCGLLSPQVNIHTDREKVYAILTNLLKNAIKYTHAGSIDFGYVRKGGDLEFYVKDTGIGVDKDKQKLIFQRFTQADNVIAKPYEGAGLGLAISRAYVEMLGGKIWVESTLDQGSCFYFTLPYSSIGILSHGEIESDDQPLQEKPIDGLKILIAEDTDYSDIYLTKIVQGISSEILHATNGNDAVDICKEHPDIDLVLMDIKMPLMDGYEATRKIREFNRKVVVIAQTAYALQGDQEKALDAGCNAYLTKPIKKQVLLDEVKKCF